jgi:hypothetical protein
MMKATLTKEICIETMNKIGVAAQVTELVSNQAKANIRSAWAAGENGSGHFSLITDSNQKALEALKKDFPDTKEHEVLVLAGHDHLGGIAEVTSKLSKADLNINYLYTSIFDDKPALILSTNDNKKALGLLNG